MFSGPVVFPPHSVEASRDVEWPAETWGCQEDEWRGCACPDHLSWVSQIPAHRTRAEILRVSAPLAAVGPRQAFHLRKPQPSGAHHFLPRRVNEARGSKGQPLAMACVQCGSSGSLLCFGFFSLSVCIRFLIAKVNVIIKQSI